MTIAAGFLIISMNGFAKKAAEFHDPIEIVFYRGLVAMALLLVYIAIKGRKDFYKTKRIKTHFGRALIGNCGVFTVFWSYKLLPMAEVTALLFSSPLIITIMSALILKESVGIYRWMAVAVGFIGVIMIMGPTADLISGYVIIIPLISSFCMASVSIYLRHLGKTEDAITSVFYFLLFGITYSAIYMMFKGTLPTPSATFLLACVGVASFVQLVLKTEAFRLAEASLLSPFTYLMLIWSVIIGWLFWGDIPSIQVLIGAGVIIISNLFITWREGVKKRALARAAVETQI